ncbi:MAG: prolyl oligopeptidase family serine peptidase, partial [Syntrophorhabdaceae bacterium]|nr:prolyl oligopeptidase family serine peptidase [Syntrophorhabdaceae bacterium]
FKENIYDDFAEYDILSEAKKVSSALVVHGEIDEVVPFQEGKAIYRNIKKPKSIEIIKGADHIFSNPAHREKAINLTLNWFRRYLLSV